VPRFIEATSADEMFGSSELAELSTSFGSVQSKCKVVQ
jgi:hypothetical protein